MRVVQIYGVSFCGSTILDLMIGNDPSGKHLSCGEIYAIFEDKGRDIYQPFWLGVRELGGINIYKKLFDKYGYSVISDSSKIQRWLLRREAEALTKGIPVHKVVMFKSPEGWVGSMLKRGNKVNIDHWVTRYRGLLRIMPEAFFLEYKTLATKPEKTLKTICDVFSIPYFKGKSKYWETKNTHVFGNSNARRGRSLEYSEDKSNKKYNNVNSDIIYRKLRDKAKLYE